nr:MAG TPA: hypothetical protein [Caudoviricetes sp.]
MLYVNNNKRYRSFLYRLYLYSIYKQPFIQT